MFRSFDTANGLPPRIYREPSEIKSDILKISRKIDETGEMLNIRALLIDILASERADKPEQLIPDLEEAISEAREALCKLHGLQDELSVLENELGDVRCRISR